MAELSDIYRCECGELLEILRGVDCDPAKCCGQDITKLTENTTDAAKEKHVPVMKKTPDGIRVQVGGVPHPMEEKHFIEWIELVCEHGVMRRYLKPGDKPEAVFPIGKGECCSSFKLREYCNLHGLWSAPGN